MNQLQNNPYAIVDEHIQWIEKQPVSPERDRLLSFMLMMGMVPAALKEMQDDATRYRNLRLCAPGCNFVVTYCGNQVWGNELDRLLDEEVL